MRAFWVILAFLVILAFGVGVFCVTDIYADAKITAQELFYLVSIIVAGGFGPFYFFGRIYYEEKRLEKDQLKQREERLWRCLQEHDKLVREIFYPINIHNENELILLREDFVRSYELFHDCLENDAEKLNLKGLELDIVLDYLACVDKFDLIRVTNLSKSKAAELTDIYQHYSALYLKSQKVIVYKII